MAKSRGYTVRRKKSGFTGKWEGTYEVVFPDGGTSRGFDTKTAAREYARAIKASNRSNPSMKMPKLGKWISAAKVRLVKKNGVKVLEIRRTVKKKTVKNTSRRKSKKAVKRGATSGTRAQRKKQYAALKKEFGF